ncbi:MAG: hypothetical protein FH748_16335 [Balneolaceae bacterium]|nr:hypothetical protein [Balneolaceae bacterium]
MKNTLVSIVCFFVLLITACQSNTDSSSRDVEAKAIIKVNTINTTTPLLGKLGWKLKEQPLLVIGSKEGELHDQFYRAYGAITLENGTFVATNSETSEIRFYSPDGTFRKSIGQQGQGPGDFAEFSNMRLYKLSKNEFVVNDPGNDRFQIYNNDGEHLKVHTMPKIEGAGNPSMNNVLSNGSWLIWSTEGSAVLRGNDGDIIEKKYLLHLFDPNFNYDKVLHRFTARKKYVNTLKGITHYPYIPLTAQPSHTTGTKAGVLFATGVNPVISRFDTSGQLTDQYKWEASRIKTEDIWERYKDEFYLATLEGRRKEQYAHFLKQDLPIPEYTPVISELKVDEDGNIWAERFQLPWHEHTTWDVLNADGEWLTTIQVPDHLRMTEIGSDYVLGFSTKNGFTQLVSYPIVKNSK